MTYSTKKGCFALSALAMLSACEVHTGTGREPQTGAQAASPTPPAATPAPAPTAPPPARSVTFHPEQGPGHGAQTHAPATTPITATTPGPVKQISVNGSALSLPTATSDTGFGGGTESPDALRGLVYFIPAGTAKFPDVSAMQPSGVLYAKQLNVPQREFTEGFPGIDSRFEWFAIRYEGTFKVAKADDYAFRILSDDGAIVYIDDVKQLDNDGLHPTKGFAQSVKLSAGTHKLRVDYFQGPRASLSLQLWVSTVTMAEKLWTASF